MPKWRQIRFKIHHNIQMVKKGDTTNLDRFIGTSRFMLHSSKSKCHISTTYHKSPDRLQDPSHVGNQNAVDNASKLSAPGCYIFSNVTWKPQSAHVLVQMSLSESYVSLPAGNEWTWEFSGSRVLTDLRSAIGGVCMKVWDYWQKKKRTKKK